MLDSEECFLPCAGIILTPFVAVAVAAAGVSILKVRKVITRPLTSDVYCLLALVSFPSEGDRAHF
ncbi:hypothetical protein D9758_013390 [Tetrapyrgos nigripes]|uniref:Uncharacterized protein n=1 Tax=Tetrapyrgos nigripes TaxID=182062 RepID=A0A8H5FNF4_9AGAR|nr:hypothetical protein D9758_013390 [Tetrapyrgos nigripes]